MMLNIQVTEEFIKKGKRKSHASCPVALAIQQAFKNRGYKKIHINVDKGFNKIMDYPFHVLWEPARPKCVTEFIEKFDNGQPVSPFEFLFEIES